MPTDPFPIPTQPQPPRFRLPRRLKLAVKLTFCLGLCALATVGCKLVDLGSHRLISPRRYDLGQDLQQVVKSPASWGLKIQAFETKTSDGLTLPGYLVTKASAPRITSIKTLFLLHGVNSRKEHMLWQCRDFTAAGYQCVIYDSRGHGEAKPGFVTFGKQEIKDFSQVILAAKKAAGGKLGPIGVFGHSMGGAVALQSLPDHPEIKAVATAGTFADLHNVIVHQAGRHYHGALRPLLAAMRWRVEHLAGFDPDKIRPVDAVSKVQTPIFIIHGKDDTVVPVSHAHRLYTACGQHRAIQKIIPAAAHGNVMSKGGNELKQEVIRFFDKYVR